MQRIWEWKNRFSIAEICVKFQLFRRVAAALPGMDSTENKPPEDSILYKMHVLLFIHLFTFSFSFYDFSLIVFLSARSGIERHPQRSKRSRWRLCMLRLTLYD